MQASSTSAVKVHAHSSPGIATWRQSLHASSATSCNSWTAFRQGSEPHTGASQACQLGNRAASDATARHSCLSRGVSSGLSRRCSSACFSCSRCVVSRLLPCSLSLARRVWAANSSRWVLLLVASAAVVGAVDSMCRHTPHALSWERNDTKADSAARRAGESCCWSCS